MPTITENTREFLERYGNALSTGDVATVADCWEVPAFVLADQGGRSVNERAEIEQFFGAAIDWYHSQGIVETRPKLGEVEQLSPRLVSADVRWAALDAAGKEQPSEHSRYILSVTDDDSLRIRVAITLE